jgi:type II secretory pathway component HofQ
VRVVIVCLGLLAVTAATARADDLCTRAHHGAAIDLDVKDADLHDVLRLLADVGHVNLVVADTVAGKVTVKLTHVPWDAAACAVAASHQLAIDVDGNILMVTPAAGSRTPHRAGR